MMLEVRILNTLFFSAAISIVFFLKGNCSNIPSTLIIPVLASLSTKYFLGDWDAGYQWSSLDIPYWFSLLLTSYATVRLLQSMTT